MRHLFGHVALVALVFIQHALQVAVGGILHDDVERLLLDKGCVVPDHVLVVQAPQHQDLHEDLALPLWGHVSALDALHAVYFAVELAAHLGYHAIGASPELGHELKVRQSLARRRLPVRKGARAQLVGVLRDPTLDSARARALHHRSCAARAARPQWR